MYPFYLYLYEKCGRLEKQNSLGIILKMLQIILQLTYLQIIMLNIITGSDADLSSC